MKSFDEIYFNAENGIIELDKLEESNILQKGRFIGNLFNKFLGSAKRRIRPADFDNTTPVTEWGFADLFGELTKRYNDPKKTNRKFYIKDLHQGVFKINEKELHPLFIEDEIEKLEIASVYKTNNGGTIILYELQDGEGETKYYVATDGKSEKFFSAEVKKGGLGMLFKAWLTSQKSNKNIFPDKGAVASKPKMPIKVIDKATYDKLVPVESVQFGESELMDEEDKQNEPRSLFYNDSQNLWKRWRKSGDPDTWAAISKFRKDDFEVDKDGNKSNDNEELLKKAKGEIVQPKSNDSKVNDKDGSEIDEKKMGELYNKIKVELESEPKKFSSKNIETGWIYTLKGNGVIYTYKSSQDGKYKISWNPAKGKARDLLIKLGYIDREDIDKDIKSLK
jgi:hypothetical protein